jgi:hypothetical protein
MALSILSWKRRGRLPELLKEDTGLFSTAVYGKEYA